MISEGEGEGGRGSRPLPPTVHGVMRRGVDVGHRVDVQVEQAIEREELRRVPVVDARVGREVVLEDVHSEAQHEDRAADAEDGQHEDREELEAQVWQQG